jgi:ubiquinone/menaquinone biosynthesis C-methylase UbiE
MDAIASPDPQTLAPARPAPPQRPANRPRIASEAENQAYFQHQLADSQTWAARMGLDFHETIRPGQKILDFGCGHGALSIQAARYGSDITGIDTNANRIDFAKRAAADFPHLASALHFHSTPVHALDGQNRFDAILSKDTFEHVENPAAILAEFHRLLRPGGCAYIGFSPLWYSPFGDHGFLTHRRLPWLHLLRGDAKFLAAHNAHTNRPDTTPAQAGFNKLTPAAFRAMAANAGLTIVTMRVNQSDGLKRVAFAPLDLARKIALLEAYATVSIYATLRK